MQLGVSLWRALDAWEDEMRARAADRGFGDIGLADSEVLICVPDGGASVSDLARRRGVSKQAMSQAVQGLTARGYLAPGQAAGDKRVKHVVPTARGRGFVAALHEIRVEMQNEAETALGTHKATLLTEDLERISAFWGAGEGS